MSNADVQIPRLPDEGARAYAARVAYITMGSERSIDKVAANQKSIKTGSRSSTLLEWSRRYDWVESARRYDDTIAGLVIQQAADEYRRKLEAHRARAEEVGNALYTVAGQLIKAINATLAGPRQIRGEDGNLYILHNIELNANTFAVVARAFTLSLDIEAHALGLHRLMAALIETEDNP